MKSDFLHNLMKLKVPGRKIRPDLSAFFSHIYDTFFEFLVNGHYTVTIDKIPKSLTLNGC